MWHFIFILTSSVSNGLLHTFPGSVQRFLSAIRFRYRIVPHGSKHSSPDNITGIFRVLCGVRPVYFSVSGQVFARNEDIVYSTCFLWFAVYAESLIWRLASPFQRAPPTMAMKLLQSPFPASAPCTFRFFLLRLKGLSADTCYSRTGTITAGILYRLFWCFRPVFSTYLCTAKFGQSRFGECGDLYRAVFKWCSGVITRAWMDYEMTGEILWCFCPKTSPCLINTPRSTTAMKLCDHPPKSTSLCVQSLCGVRQVDYVSARSQHG